MISAVACSEALGFCYWPLIGWVSCCTCLNLQSNNLECWKRRKHLQPVTPENDGLWGWALLHTGGSQALVLFCCYNWALTQVASHLWKLLCPLCRPCLASEDGLARASSCWKVWGFSRGSFNCEKLTKPNLWPCLFLEKGSRSTLVSPLQSRLEALWQLV